MGLLERLGFPAGHATKIIDGYHPEQMGVGNKQAKPDMLPLDDMDSSNAQGNRNILVAVRGDDLDTEVITLACQLALAKKVSVFAVYGIEVPRKLPIDAEMPSETDAAQRALQRVNDVAAQMHVRIDTEVVQSRSFGQSLVDEAEAHGCALLILGLPYQQGMSGQFEIGETAEYVLKYSPARVWLVRGKRPERPADRTERGERLEGATVAK